MRVVARQESTIMPKLKYDHPVIQKGAVLVFAHLMQKPVGEELRKVGPDLAGSLNVFVYRV